MGDNGMIILGLDTSGPACSVAVSKDGAILQEIVMNTALTHSETLMPAVEKALEGAGLSVRDADLISVIAGPGSFTGVRIGVCAARALAHAAGKRLSGSIPFMRLRSACLLCAALCVRFSMHGVSRCIPQHSDMKMTICPCASLKTTRFRLPNS